MRFAATKLVEGDERIRKALQLDQNEEDALEHIIQQMERERGLTGPPPLRICALASSKIWWIKPW